MFAFTKAINIKANSTYKDFVVVAASPYINPKISDSKTKLENTLEKLKEFHVRIVDSISVLFDQVDYITTF